MQADFMNNMNNRKKVLVALSGGVDSSVAAAVLKQKGFEVVGIYMKFLPRTAGKNDPVSEEKSAGAAASLGIEHYTIDLSRQFHKKVINYFIKGYTLGNTPNPCVVCNPYMKFDTLLTESRKIGASYIATGHYARIGRDLETGRSYIKRAADKKKDQSYFLYLLSQKHISRTLLPLGDMSKAQVIEKAETLDLPAAHQKESQEICFIPDSDYVGFMKEKTLTWFAEGPITDKEGNVLGKHRGYARFTIGQRRGLRLSAPHPLYVLDIDPRKNAVIVGPEGSLYKKTFKAIHLNWISGQILESSLLVKAQIRYKHRAQEAVVSPNGSGMVQVEFSKPQRAVTPGQAVVFYKGDTLLGGGTIIRDQS